MKLNPKSQSKSRRATVVAISIIVLLVAGYTAFAHQTNRWPFAPLSPYSTEMDAPGTISNNTDTNPSSDADVSDEQSAKQRMLDETDNNSNDEGQPTTSDGGPKKTVRVGVSYADIYENNLEIRAFTNGVIESGSCQTTATLVGTDTTVTKSSQAFIDVSTTQCEPIYIPVSSLKSGKWIVVVEFVSDTHSGKSEPREVTVP